MKFKNRIYLLFAAIIFCNITNNVSAKIVYDAEEESSEYIAEISQFNFFIEDENLILYWSTTIEKNAFQFEVQRRNIDSKEWETRETIIAYGNSKITKEYNYFEENPVIGASFYRLKIIDINGNIEYCKQIVVEFNKLTIGLDKELQNIFGLSQNYYNTYRATNELTYKLPENSKVKLAVLNSEGKIIINLIDDYAEAGEHHITWKKTNLSTGIYYLRLTAQTHNNSKFFNATKKLLISN